MDGLRRLSPQIRAKFRPWDAGSRLDGHGAAWRDGVRFAGIPQIAPAQNSGMSHPEQGSQLANPARFGDGGGDRVFSGGVHDDKFVSIPYRCQEGRRKLPGGLVSDNLPPLGHLALMDADHFQDRFRWACAKAGYDLAVRGNQARLAVILGVKSQAISQWLGQSTFPATEKMILIAEKLRISLDWLFTGRGNPIPGTSLTEEEWALIHRWRAYSPSQQAKISGLVDEIPPRAEDCEKAA